MKQLYQLIISILVLFSGTIHAQNTGQTDSLLAALENAEQTNYALILDQIAQIQDQLPSQNAFVIGAQALAITQSLSFLDATPHAYRNVAQLHLQENNFSEGLDLAFHALQFADKNNLTYEMSKTIAFLAEIYSKQGNITLSIEYNFSAAELFRKIELTQEAAQLYGQVGHLYFEEKDFDKAVFYYEEALKIAQDEAQNKIQNPIFISLYLNAGIAYRKLKKYDVAFRHLNLGLRLAQKSKNTSKTALITGEIGKIYQEQGNLSIASRYMEMDLNLSIRTGDWANVAEVLNHIGEIQTASGNYRLAEKYYDSALVISRKIKNLDILENTYKGLSELYVKRKDFQKAYQFHVIFSNVRDSLIRRRNALNLAKVHASHNLEKKQAEIERLTENNEAHEATIKKQTVVNLLIIMVLVLVTGLTFMFFRANKQRTKDNEMLKQRQEEIQMQRDALQAKGNELETAFELLKKSNKRMTDSINYARHIQTSIFPSVAKIQKTLPEHFILFQPRDVVSGDFYWAVSQANRTILAAVDCTGHGVPGAFLSMIGNDILHEIVILKGISEADKILNALHLGVRAMLRQEETENRDGMDISLCVIYQTARNSAPNAEMPRLEFAGAKNPLVYIQNHQMHIIKGDKHPIGGKQQEEKRLFTKHIVPLGKPTTFYIFSDGFQDQFGGAEGRKFMRKQFYEMLYQIHELPAKAQKKHLEKTILNWMSPAPGQEYRQIDDILVIGAKIS